MEQWKTIPGFEGLYEASNTGLIRSVDRIIVDKNNKQYTYHGRLLKPGQNKWGYKHVHLSKDSRMVTIYIHKVVATLFIDNPSNLTVVNHKDGNKANNHVDNLEWCTQQYNIVHAINNGLMTSISNHRGKPVICVETGMKFKTALEASKYIGCCITTMSMNIRKNRMIKGFHFEYLPASND